MTGSILDCIGNTPLVPLARVAGDCPVPILGKCEHLNPGGSVKDRLALAIVRDAEARGRLKPGDTLIEATAGNTGIGLAMVAAVLGYKLVCVMPEKMSRDKRHALRAMGAELVIAPNKPLDDPDNFQRMAERLASENGWFLTDQFRNPANVEVHERTTARELIEQTGGHIGAFVCGVGTGGTITGVGRVLKREVPDARVVLSDPAGSALAGLVNDGEAGAAEAYALEGIGGSEPPDILDLDAIDRAEVVTDEQAFAMTWRLIREEGLLVGGSAGAAVEAALRVAHSGEVNRPVVALLPDSWDRYFTSPWLTVLP